MKWSERVKASKQADEAVKASVTKLEQACERNCKVTSSKPPRKKQADDDAIELSDADITGEHRV